MNIPSRHHPRQIGEEGVERGETTTLAADDDIQTNQQMDDDGGDCLVQSPRLRQRYNVLYTTNIFYIII